MTLDRTLELLKRGYRFAPDVLRRAGSDVAEIRLLGRPAVLMSGRDAVRCFYDESTFQRQGATPRPLRRTLFGEGAVHGLDGVQHRQRKAMFLGLLTPEAAREIAALAARGWEAAMASWHPRRPVSLFDTAVQVHGDAVCAWAGVPAERADTDLARDLATIVDGFGSVGPRAVRARMARRRADWWASALIPDVRGGAAGPPPGSALHVIAASDLPAGVAGVELLNILRPTVAVAYLVTFAALALRDTPRSSREPLATGDAAALEAFAQEVRRFYPFVPVLAARSRRPFQFGGRLVPARRWVLLDVYGTLHNPALWSDPYRFDPDRFMGRAPDPDVLIPQGGGPPEGHRCPGERVAVELIKVAVHRLAITPHEVASEDAHVSLTRMPTRPQGGLLVIKLHRDDQATTLQGG